MEKKQLQLDKQVVRRLHEDQMAQLAGGNDQGSMTVCFPVPTIVFDTEIDAPTNDPEEPQSCCRKSC